MNSDFYDEQLKTHSCYVVCADGSVCTLCDSGIKPLLKLIENNKLKGAKIADRVVGRAAALLMVYGGVQQVYTKIISKYAIEIFDKYHINYTAKNIVPYIINRTKNGMCPMENLCLDIDLPKIAYEILRDKVK